MWTETITDVRNATGLQKPDFSHFHALFTEPLVNLKIGAEKSSEQNVEHPKQLDDRQRKSSLVRCLCFLTDP